MATAEYLFKNTTCQPYFVPVEEPLKAMNTHLYNNNAKVDHRKSYNADAVIRFRDLFDLKVLLLETYGSFKNKSERKILIKSTFTIDDMYVEKMKKL